MIEVKFNINEQEYVLKIENSKRIIDLKRFIIKKYYDDNEEIYIDLENINEKVKKNFGKMYLDKGMIPRIFDNYELSKFLDDEDKLNVKIVVIKDIKKEDENKRYIESEKRVYMPPSKRMWGFKEDVKKFVYNDDDFPKLG